MNTATVDALDSNIHISKARNEKNGYTHKKKLATDYDIKEGKRINSCIRMVGWCC